jgi:hypothetical protein
MELELTDYIDADEGRDFGDATASGVVEPCENCGRTGERLTLVPEWEYMGCDDCMGEALAALAAEAAAKKPAARAIAAAPRYAAIGNGLYFPVGNGKRRNRRAF